MKIKCIFLSLAIVVNGIFFSCGGSIIDNKDSQAQGSPKAIDSAPYKYYNSMYAASKGQNLNSQMLKGAVYDKYPTEVQQMVNLLLRFPLQTASLDTGATTADFLNTPWWESLPQSMKDYFTSIGVDIVSGGVSEGLADFFNSPEGKQIIEAQLDLLDTRLKTLIDYGIDQLAEQFEDEMDSLLADATFAAISMGVMAGATVAQTMLADTIALSLNPLSSCMTAGSMIMGFMQHQEQMAINAEILNKLNQVLIKLEVVNKKLDLIDQKINTLLGYSVDISVWMHYEDMRKAKLLLESMQNQINYYMQTGDTGMLTSFNDFLTDVSPDGFESILVNALDSANQTHLWLRNNNLIKKVNVDKIRVIEYEDVYGQHTGAYAWSKSFRISTEFLIELPSYFIDVVINGKEYSIGYEDISLLIKLSRMRFDTAKLIYSGDKLLQYRKYYAKYDINNVFNPIDSAIDNALIKIDEKINSAISFAFKQDYYLDTRLGIFYIKYFYDLEHNGTVVYGRGWQESSRLNRIRNQTGGILPVAIYSPEYKDGLSDSEFVQRLRDLVKQEYAEQYSKNYLVQLKANVAAWKIILQAHIDAGNI